MKLSLFALLSTGVFIAPLVTQAAAHAEEGDDERFVYYITTALKGQKPDRAGSGFLLPGAGGIVTCLHLVVGRDSFRATTSGGTPIKDQDALKIIKVDIKRDLAVISSPEVAKLKTGMNLALGEDLETLKEATLEVVGYPAGVNKREFNIPIKVLKTPLRKIDDFLNDDMKTSFKERKSPNPELKVLALAGHLYPGHSGSPVKNANGAVIAVADGAIEYRDIRPGFDVLQNVGLSWAIPLNVQPEWANPEDPAVLAELNRVAEFILQPGILAISQPGKMDLILAEYAVLEPEPGMLATVMYKPAREALPAMANELINAFRLMQHIPANQGNSKQPPKTNQISLDALFAMVGGELGAGTSKLFFTVPSGTQVQILEHTEFIIPGGQAKVRILTGQSKGKVGWVPGDMVKKKQATPRN